MLLLAQAAAATNAWAASRLLAASNARVTVKSAPGVITGEDMTRVRAVEAWLDKGGPPPQHWEVKTKADVSIGKELARGRSKCVRHRQQQSGGCPCIRGCCGLRQQQHRCPSMTVRHFSTPFSIYRRPIQALSKGVQILALGL